jgi:hypothetical protein
MRVPRLRCSVSSMMVAVVVVLVVALLLGQEIGAEFTAFHGEGRTYVSGL